MSNINVNNKNYSNKLEWKWNQTNQTTEVPDGNLHRQSLRHPHRLIIIVAVILIILVITLIWKRQLTQKQKN